MWILLSTPWTERESPFFLDIHLFNTLINALSKHSLISVSIFVARNRWLRLEREFEIILIAFIATKYKANTNMCRFMLIN